MTTAAGKRKHRQTLSKAEIIRGFGQIQVVLEKGRKYHGKYVLLFCVGEKSKKVGFIVSRKYKKAVERNHLRRLLREAYRQNKAEFGPGHWVFYGKHGSQQPGFAELESDILKLAQKIRGNDE